MNLVLRPHFEKESVEYMKSSPFCSAIDGSNDNDLQKMNPMTVRMFDSSRGRICTGFVDMCLIEGT